MCMFPMLNNRRHSRNRSGRIRIVSVVLLAAVILGLLFLVIGNVDRWKTAKQGLILVDTRGQNLRWSKDGQALFYLVATNENEEGNYKWRLFRYDVSARAKRSYDIPGQIDQYDISPDGESIAYLHSQWRNGDSEYHVRILRLDTGRARTIYRSGKKVGNVFWLTQNKIVFDYDLKQEGGSLLITDAKGNILKQLRDKYYTGLYTAYGRGIVYAGRDRRYHYYDVETGADKTLDMHGVGFGSTTTWFFYLSDQLLVYRTTDRPWGDVELLDVHNGRSKRIRGIFPKGYGGDVGISPDMSRYWLQAWGVGERVVPKRYIGTFPKRVTEEFAAFRRASNKDQSFGGRGVRHP